MSYTPHHRLRVAVAMLWIGIAGAALATPDGPPPAPSQPVTDTYHGVAVADPYRNLEDVKNPQTLAWLRARWGAAAPPWAIHAVCRLAQARAGWRDARQRRATLRQDERLDRMLAFTGTAE